MEGKMKKRVRLMRYLAPLVKQGVLAPEEQMELDALYLKTESPETVADALRLMTGDEAVLDTATRIESDSTLKKEN